VIDRTSKISETSSRFGAEMECHADMNGNVGCKQAAGSLSAQRRPATASGFRATGSPLLPERSAEPIGLREADVDLQR
jgi:hypothetical protein